MIGIHVFQYHFGLKEFISPLTIIKPIIFGLVSITNMWLSDNSVNYTNEYLFDAGASLNINNLNINNML